MSFRQVDPEPQPRPPEARRLGSARPATGGREFVPEEVPEVQEVRMFANDDVRVDLREGVTGPVTAVPQGVDDWLRLLPGEGDRAAEAPGAPGAPVLEGSLDPVDAVLDPVLDRAPDRGVDPAVLELVSAEDVDEELRWQERALCAQTDPEAFFPEKGGSTREAKRVCLGCDVRTECLEYALSHDERFGIWGGMSERERRRLRKRAI